MGLDMYLERRHYVQRWEHTKPEKQFLVTVTRGGEPYPLIDPERVSYVIEQVAYWRKANAIHAWFVRNVQEGKDDCGDYYVSPEQLSQLLAVVNAVLDGNSKAEDALPVQGGFFFGGTDYDKHYTYQLKQTKEQLERLAGWGDHFPSHYYHASW